MIPIQVLRDNKVCAVEPFPERANQPEIKNGIAVTAKTKVVELESLSDIEEVVVGVRAIDSSAPWAREVFETPDEVRFILVPTNRVLYFRNSRVAQ